MLKICHNPICENDAHYFDESYCRSCGEEVLAAPHCLCGKTQVHLRNAVWWVKRGKPQHCTACGAKHDEAFLAAVMRDTLASDLNAIRRAAESLN